MGILWKEETFSINDDNCASGGTELEEQVNELQSQEDMDHGLGEASGDCNESADADLCQSSSDSSSGLPNSMLPWQCTAGRTPRNLFSMGKKVHSSRKDEIIKQRSKNGSNKKSGTSNWKESTFGKSPGQGGVEDVRIDKLTFSQECSWNSNASTSLNDALNSKLKALKDRLIVSGQAGHQEDGKFSHDRPYSRQGHDSGLQHSPPQSHPAAHRLHAYPILGPLSVKDCSICGHINVNSEDKVCEICGFVRFEMSNPKSTPFKSRKNKRINKHLQSNHKFSSFACCYGPNPKSSLIATATNGEKDDSSDSDRTVTGNQATTRKQTKPNLSTSPRSRNHDGTTSTPLSPGEETSATSIAGERIAPILNSEFSMEILERTNKLTCKENAPGPMRNSKNLCLNSIGRGQRTGEKNGDIKSSYILVNFGCTTTQKNSIDTTFSTILSNINHIKEKSKVPPLGKASPEAPIYVPSRGRLTSKHPLPLENYPGFFYLSSRNLENTGEDDIATTLKNDTFPDDSAGNVCGGARLEIVDHVDLSNKNANSFSDQQGSIFDHQERCSFPKRAGSYFLDTIVPFSGLSNWGSMSNECASDIAKSFRSTKKQSAKLISPPCIQQSESSEYPAIKMPDSGIKNGTLKCDSDLQQVNSGRKSHKGKKKSKKKSVLNSQPHIQSFGLLDIGNDSAYAVPETGIDFKENDHMQQKHPKTFRNVLLKFKDADTKETWEQQDHLSVNPFSKEALVKKNHYWLQVHKGMTATEDTALRHKTIVNQDTQKSHFISPNETVKCPKPLPSSREYSAITESTHFDGDFLLNNVISNESIEKNTSIGCPCKVNAGDHILSQASRDQQENFIEMVHDTVNEDTLIHDSFLNSLLDTISECKNVSMEKDMENHSVETQAAFINSQTDVNEGMISCSTADTNQPQSTSVKNCSPSETIPSADLAILGQNDNWTFPNKETWQICSASFLSDKRSKGFPKKNKKNNTQMNKQPLGKKTHRKKHRKNQKSKEKYDAEKSSSLESVIGSDSCINLLAENGGVNWNKERYSFLLDNTQDNKLKFENACNFYKPEKVSRPTELASYQTAYLSALKEITWQIQNADDERYNSPMSLCATVTESAAERKSLKSIGNHRSKFNYHDNRTCIPENHITGDETEQRAQPKESGGLETVNDSSDLKTPSAGRILLAGNVTSEWIQALSNQAQSLDKQHDDTYLAKNRSTEDFQTREHLQQLPGISPLHSICASKYLAPLSIHKSKDKSLSELSIRDGLGRPVHTNTPKGLTSKGSSYRNIKQFEEQDDILQSVSPELDSFTESVGLEQKPVMAKTEDGMVETAEMVPLDTHFQSKPFQFNLCTDSMTDQRPPCSSLAKNE